MFMFSKKKLDILVFFTSLFVFISFAGTRLFLSDDGVILNQFYNLIHGSISIENLKINLIEGIYLIIGDKLYGKFSYSLLFLSLPVYYILKYIDMLYGVHLFTLQLWAFSGGVIVYTIAKTRQIKHPEIAGAISYFILIAAVNMYFFKPIYFPVWGELLSIEFTNILISSFLVLFVYLFFKNLFSDKLAIFASFFVIFATPVSFYAITLKHHSLSLLLTVLTFYFFYKYQMKKEKKFIYSAYALAGLCVWTRILDGAVLLAALLLIDIVISRRSAKYILSILIIIVISLMPFFSFNYLILGDPFSLMEKTQGSEKPITVRSGQDMILFQANTSNPVLDDLLKSLGYSENAELKSDGLNVLLDITFLKLQNTFGIFLVSPFLIVALAFMIDRIKQKIKLNTIDKFLGVYTILFIYSYKDYLLMIISGTAMVLEYRYLLILYITLLYFALRINKVKDLIESRLKIILLLYVVILIMILSYFIREFPVPFMNIYYYAALITSLSLLMLLSISLLAKNTRSFVPILDSLIIFAMATSLALASSFLLFYYWYASMIYISPSQNYTILPVLEIAKAWAETLRI